VRAPKSSEFPRDKSPIDFALLVAMRSVHGPARSIRGPHPHAVTLFSNPLAGELFGTAFAVDVGGVDQIDARIHGGVEYAPRLVVRRGDALHEGLRFAEGHRAQAENAHLQTGLTESAQLHGP